MFRHTALVKTYANLARQLLICRPAAPVVLLGESGVGKTTLLSWCQNTLEGIRFVSPQSTTARGILHDLLAALEGGGTTGQKVLSTAALQRRLQAELSRIRGLCLMIDDADRLSDDTLLALMDDWRRCGAPQHQNYMMLVGKPELGSRLANLAPGLVNPGKFLTLQGMSASAVTDFLAQSADHAGDHFEHQAIDIISLASGGIPARVQALAGEARVLARQRGDVRISATMARESVRLYQRGRQAAVAAEYPRVVAASIPQRQPGYPVARSPLVSSGIAAALALSMLLTPLQNGKQFTPGLDPVDILPVATELAMPVLPTEPVSESVEIHELSTAQFPHFIRPGSLAMDWSVSATRNFEQSAVNFTDMVVHTHP